MRTQLFCILGVALLGVCSSAFADLPGPPPGTPRSSLSFLPGEDVDDASGAPSVQGPLKPVTDATKPHVPNVVFYNFGTVSNARTTPIVHEFVLRNASSESVSIDHLLPGCGCVTASVNGSKQGTQLLVAPGSVFSVHVSIDTKQLYVGTINKIVWIFLAGQTTPAFTMHVAGRTTSMASFEPSEIDLGTVRLGHAPIEKIAVTTDTDVYGPHPPNPFCLGGALVIKLDPTAEKRKGTQLVRTYDLTLAPHVHLGMLSDTVAVPLNDGTKRPGPSLLVTGNITGSISATPSSIEFGAADKGKVLERMVVLAWATHRLSRGLTLISHDPSLKLALKQVKPTSAVLCITYKPTATGALDTKVTVSSAPGEQLDLPVTAWVN